MRAPPATPVTDHPGAVPAAVPAPAEVDVSEPALLIRINQRFRPDLSEHALYEATRGVWKLGPRRTRAAYALAVFGGVVREVYEIASWHAAGTTAYTTRTPDEVAREGRWEFLGGPAPAALRARYVVRSVAHYFERGNANPLYYVNC